MTQRLVDTFHKQLDMFVDSRFADIIAGLMIELPDTILDLPASTTGKYHPEDELDKNGMTIHIKRACELVEDATRKYNFSKYGHDVLLAGCLLHDIFKDGNPPTGHTVTEHPALIYEFIVPKIKLLSFEGAFLKDVAWACAWHEGIWTTEIVKNSTIPETPFAKALHEIDFWVTRRTMWELMRPEWIEANK